MEKKGEVRTKRSIRLKIMTMTTVIVIGVMLVCAMILRYSMKNLTESILLDVLQPMAGESAKAVESNIHLMADRMMGLATDSRLAGARATNEERAAVLREARNTYEFYGIGVYGLDGIALVTDGDIYEALADTEWFALMQETDNLTIADPLVTEEYVGIPMGMPVKTDGATSAYLVGVYKYDMLSEVLGAIHIGETGMALIINEEGKVVGHPVTEVVREEVNIYDLDTTETAHRIFDRMITRETGNAQGVVNGQESYVAFCPVRGTRWSFAVEVPKADYTESMNIALYNTMMGTVFALIVALIAIWLVTTVISGQLKKAIVRMNRLAEGDLRSPIEVRHSGDEVEVLSVSLQTTVESINGCLTEIQRVLDNISRGNLNIAASGDYRGDFVVVKDALTQIINSLNAMVKQINQTAYRLMDTAKNMGSQSAEMHQSVVSQTVVMMNLTSEVKNIKDNLGNVTENTHETHRRTSEIAEQIADGSQKMEQLREAMEAIERSTEDITKISKLIEEISKQTNILALNAAVEAARAGDAGKGFAVVAQEVRNLAGQSAESAQSTMEMIETASELIRQGVSLTVETAESLDAIRRGSDAVTEIADRLSAAVDLQEASLNRITGKIEDMSEITQQNLRCAERTSNASAELKLESEKLRELLERFQFH